jgi:antitoxin HicB
MSSKRGSHVGSSLDDFLKEEGIYEECVNMAVKAIIAEQIAATMEAKRITKSELAKKMNTSRAAVNRLLDPSSDAVTLESLKSAATFLGKRIRLELV